VHLRRALLLFALVLGLTAVAASIAPAPRSDRQVQPAPPPASDAGAAGQVALTLKPPAPGRPVPVRRVAPGSLLSLTVAAGEPGQVLLPALGRTATVTASTPARFPLLAPSAGRYSVTFAPVDGPPRQLGTIVITG
jgi:hypothetical protein